MLETVKYVIGSPGPSGYGSKSTAEQVTDRRDLRSIAAVTTGATSGIGAETARALAKRGARLVLPGRSLKAAEDAKARIASECPGSEIIVMALDLSSLTSIRNFVAEFESLRLASQPSHMDRIAVVTGGNKGIGFEICKELALNGVFVVVTARDVNRGNEAIEKLASIGISNVVFHPLDVVDSTSADSLADFIKSQFGKLDILVNNAGITGATHMKEDLVLTANYLKGGPQAKSMKQFVKETYELAENCLRTNYYGIKTVTAALLPLLQQSRSAKVVNVSSSLGQLQYIPGENIKEELNDIDSLTEEKVDSLVARFLKDMKEDTVETGGWPILLSAYIVSKATLNAYTRVLAKKYPGIAINAVNPGFTKTDLNRNTGFLPVEEGVRGPVMVALLPKDGPSGVFFDQTVVSTF